MIESLGKVTTNAGTPVRLTTNEADPTTRYSAHAVLVQAVPANTGRVYVGKAGMNKTTLAGVVGILAIPTDNVVPSFSAALTIAPNALVLNDLYLDVDVNGEGALVSALVQ